MKKVITFEQEFAAPLEEVWKFFTDSTNLKVLTPSKMKLKFMDEFDSPIIYEGMVIRYFVSPLFSIPMYWETEIIAVKERYYFIDIQKKGPFKSWKHTHQFEETPTGVKMIDQVVYEMPLGKIGDMVHDFTVKKELQQMFQYRHMVCEKIFN